jgi:putative transposase
MQERSIVERVQAVRRRQPRVGGRKLHQMLKPVGIGRDRFFEILKDHQLLVKVRRSGHRTTYAGRKRFPNRLKSVVCRRMALVADITYIRTREGFLYLFLVTHYASRKILGYCLSRDLSAQGSVKALKRALRRVPCSEGMIHHSDRGFQYSSESFLKLIKDQKMLVSMTEEDHVYENATAERVNGILKQEFALGTTLTSQALAQRQVSEAITIYNNERLHTSLGYATPAQKYAETCQLFQDGTVLIEHTQKDTPYF